MGTPEELKYYQQRAEREIELAQTATHENAVRAHYEMAALYLDRVHDGDAGRSTTPALHSHSERGIAPAVALQQNRQDRAELIRAQYRSAALAYASECANASQMASHTAGDAAG
ncbi:MAG TPA: hypothetical protein VNQ74_09795 [Burkholderiaceae bacterium]|nr:hypothetical protein [Burkholderiaceae bacterium]